MEDLESIQWLFLSFQIFFALLLLFTAYSLKQASSMLLSDDSWD